MSISPSSNFPQEPEEPRGYHPQVTEPPRNWFPVVTIVGLVVLFLAVLFLFYELNDTRKQLNAQVAELRERTGALDRNLAVSTEKHNSLRGEVLMTREKLGVTERDLGRARALAQQLGEEQKQQAQAAEQRFGQVAQEITTVKQESGAKLGALSGEVTTAKTDIATTRKDLEATKLQLTSAIGDINKASTLIARNYEELQELRRRGERNYLEFDLAKEKQPRRIGDVLMQLRKADPKNQRYSVVLIAEDAKTEKKDKTVNEPVQFYMGRSRALYEIVVNRISKDRIIGYLATPKHAAQ